MKLFKVYRGVCLLTFRTKGQHQGPGTTALAFVQKEQGRGGETSPPTKAALKEHILRAHYQAMIWLLVDTAKPNLPSPTNYGWDE